MSDAFQIELDLIFLQELNQCRYSVTENALYWIYGLEIWGIFLLVCKHVDSIVTLLYNKGTESIGEYVLSFLSCMTFALPQMIIAIVVVKVDFDCDMGIAIFSVLYDIIVHLKKILTYTECRFNENKNYRTFTQILIDIESVDQKIHLQLFFYYFLTLTIHVTFKLYSNYLVC